MTTLLQDLRFALRMLLKSPGFTAVAVATLALGIGANTAIFSVVHAVLLRPLPYTSPERLVAVGEDNVGRGFHLATASPPNFFDWRRRASRFEAMAAYDPATLELAGAGAPERVEGTACSPELFAVLGTPPLLGRAFVAEDARPGGARVAVLSHRLWRQRFGADRAILGRSVILDGVARQVVGVMPSGFAFPERHADLWVPLRFGPDVDTQRGAHYLRVVGRLKPGVSAAQADAQVRAIAGALAAQYPETNAGWSASVEPLRLSLVRDVRPGLLVLLAAVGLVALIACANVANLSLARAAGRRQELSIRFALGAGRGRIVRQLLTEAMVLALAGGAAAAAMAAWCTGLLVRMAPGSLPRANEIVLDGPVFAFTAALAAATGLLFGLLPAWSASRDARRDGAPGSARGATAGSAVSRSRWSLVVAETGLALMLLVGAGLMLKSFARLLAVDPGFDPRSVLSFEVSLPESRYPTGERVTAFYRDLLPRLAALPGARSAGAVLGLPLTDFGFSSSFRETGRPSAATEADELHSQVRLASRDYFATARIPLLRGRLFTAADRRGTPGVLLASESAARKFWPGGDAIGRRLRFAARPSDDRIEGEIVGIVGDVRESGLDSPPTPLFYGSLDQVAADTVSVLVRTGGRPETLAAAVTAAVAKLDPSLPVARLAPLEEVVADSLARPRFYLRLLSLFALLATGLAAVGIAGVTAYTVAQRTREIGVRAALGAGRRDILRLVFAQSLRPVLLGAAAGVGASLLLTRFLAGLLYGVTPTDPATFAATVALILATATTACVLPALRAARINPMEALRQE